MKEIRSKAKAKKAKQDAENKHRLFKLAVCRKDLQKVNTTLRNQMFSD